RSRRFYRAPAVRAFGSRVAESGPSAGYQGRHLRPGVRRAFVFSQVSFSESVGKRSASLGKATPSLITTCATRGDLPASDLRTTSGVFPDRRALWSGSLVSP